MLLTDALDYLNWTTPTQQEAAVQIMCFYGCDFCEEFSDQKISTRFLSHEETNKVLHKNTSLDEVNQKLQLRLLRPQDTERHDLPDDNLDPELKKQLIKYYRNLGLIDAKSPNTREFDAILILGSRQKNYEIRLNYLTTLMKTDNPVSGQIFLLGSDRELWPEYEPISAKLTKPTEISMMETIFQKSELKNKTYIPIESKNMPTVNGLIREIQLLILKNIF